LELEQLVRLQQLRDRSCCLHFVALRSAKRYDSLATASQGTHGERQLRCAFIFGVLRDEELSTLRIALVDEHLRLSGAYRLLTLSSESSGREGTTLMNTASALVIAAREVDSAALDHSDALILAMASCAHPLIWRAHERNGRCV